MDLDTIDRIARILAPALENGEHDKIRENLDNVVENIYYALGTYGRGDVRQAILFALNDN